MLTQTDLEEMKTLWRKAFGRVWKYRKWVPYRSAIQVRVSVGKPAVIISGTEDQIWAIYTAVEMVPKLIAMIEELQKEK